ncbi:MAG: hypothetical protein HY744_32040 [Deltaproteobacteria bacterium]|nr:hypothetical protein [Deltaproteobacteria bacterium]
MVRAWALVLSPPLLAVAGCTATVVEEGDGGESAALAAQGSVAVERIEAVFGGASQVRARVSAHFMRVGGLAQDVAERVLGSPLELPAGGTCAWREPPGAAQVPPPEAAAGSIELLDVGDMVLRAGASTTPLAARAFPDVGEIVSGVVYTSRDDSAELPVGTTYLFETSGSALVEGFSMQLEAPDAPEGLGVAGRPVAGDVPSVGAGQPVALRWTAGRPAAGDRIYVDVTGVERGAEARGLVPAQERTLRCSFEDGGAAELPARFAVWPAAQEIEIAVHRWRRLVLKPSAIDSAVVDFDFAVTVRAAVVEPPAP